MAGTALAGLSQAGYSLSQDLAKAAGIDGTDAPGAPIPVAGILP